MQRIKADGDCLYQSLIAAGLSAVPNSVQDLRDAVADELESVSGYEADSVRRGGWVGLGADRAPGILANKYDITFHVIHPNAVVEQVGNGSRAVYLMLIDGPPQHFHFVK